MVASTLSVLQADKSLGAPVDVALRDRAAPLEWLAAGGLDEHERGLAHVCAVDNRGSAAGGDAASDALIEQDLDADTAWFFAEALCRHADLDACSLSYHRARVQLHLHLQRHGRLSDRRSRRA